MDQLLSLAGRSALSPFRLTKLLQRLAQVRPEHAVARLQATYRHFIELARPLPADERRTLDDLLTYGEVSAEVKTSPQASWLVVPRPGTISPWSSKATDIARNCGLDAVRRIERGVVFDVETVDGVPLHADDRAALLPLIHDRMTEAVLFDVDAVQSLFAHVPPPPLTTIPLHRDGKAALVAANAALGLALARDEIDFLDLHFRRMQRDPTDVELMMFAQANSEHCRHKIFNADWIVDGVQQPQSLFDMIRETHRAHPAGTVVAYSDNAAVMEGATVARFYPREGGRYGAADELTHTLMKVETHNHPTAIAPFPGAATGAGGEIRDEGATGIGAKPKAGLNGFSVSHLRIPGLPQPWEGAINGSPPPVGKPERIASAFTIMLDGPIGAAAFNNEFGRPNLAGYFRTFEQYVGGEWRGYHKPIMLAGGVGNIRAEHTHKNPLPAGTLLIQLGGPGMLIGMGGGAASSMATGVNTADLDFDSVQRGNAEMERRAQEVIDRCWQLGAANPILSLHDVGAGGLSNALPELVHGGDAGGTFDLRAIPSEESGMAPREIWCNEAQERYVLAIAPAALPAFTALCARERCPFAVVGTANAEGHLQVADALFANHPVDVPLDVILGKAPKMLRNVQHASRALPSLDLTGITVREAAYRVLQLPAVSDKTFLITIGDRTVGGLCARDPMVGPWQVPVADVAVTLMDFTGYAGEAMAVGERTPLALIDAPASGRMAVAEAITNIAAAPIAKLSDIKLSANWMAPAGHPGEDAALYDTVRAVAIDTCVQLGLSIPVGKDSMSMRTTWTDGEGDKAVTAPISLVVSAFAPVVDVRHTLTPWLPQDAGPLSLVLIDLARGQRRLGGSALAQVFGQLGNDAPDLDDPQQLAAFFAFVRYHAKQGEIIAYHDVADGGLFAALAEVAFANHCGLDITLDGIAAGTLAALFAEELGAVVAVRADAAAALVRATQDVGLAAAIVGTRNATGRLTIVHRGTVVLDEARVDLQRAWSATSHAMQMARDNPAVVAQEYDALNDISAPGMTPRVTFDADADIAVPFVATGARPRIAILREQGVNGQVEMAAAFDRAGFAAFDVHMSDLTQGRHSLADFNAFVACGGFSFGDVLGAGEGWAKSIRFNPRLYDGFAAFFARSDVLALGVCNGCQMMSNLRDLIPGAAAWPRFLRNRSEQFEGRLTLLEVMPSPSLFFKGMEGSRLPVVTAHGEGFAAFADAAALAAAQPLVSLRYIDARGAPTEQYPHNPNGSPLGITGLTTSDGRYTILMPHPERVHRSVQMSWHPPGWGDASPWMRMFRNARVWLGATEARNDLDRLRD